MNPNPRVPKPAGNGEPKQPIGIPSRPAVAGFAPFSWDLSYNSIEALPPPIPDRLRSLRILEPQEASDNPTSSSPPQSMTEAMLASAIGIIVTPTPVSRSGYSPPVYSLPKSYEKDFKVKQALGFGAFGEVAIVRVIAADDGGIAHGFRLRPGIELVAKKIRTDPIKQHTIYSREWNILDTLRGHRNLLHAVWDLSGLMKNYKDDLRERKQKHGFSRFITPKEFLWLGALPEGVAYEVMTNVARGLAWMQYGIRDWPRDSAIDPDWTAIMHNDIKPDNVFMVSREPGDECPYPIFKIGDLGAASKTDTVAFVGNTATASPAS
ncbi:uncharacterized protein DFL_000131 [Arthrobotrys flagrans]|uniref:Protein kinase domain-containing protein n=1 Tax=Arthrobotrys flagrans TaxID=97331 RepID=A0A437AEF7_ARTFL|nr:hypothetical protein DFL_000131 [Arthrobotrys flagrans]